MTMSDPIADMLTRIRNANTAKHDTVDVPSSKMKLAIAQILLDEGYIKKYDIVEDGGFKTIHITLKYGEDKNDKIIFTDSAKLAHSENGLVKDSAAGARITYDLLNAKSRVEGETVNGQKTRVSTVLAPRAKPGTTQPAPRRAAPSPMTGSSRLEY